MSKKKSLSLVATNGSPAFVVVIGASLGGIDALTKLVGILPREADAAYFIAIHVSEEGTARSFAARLKQVGPLPCDIAMHNAPIKKGHIYIAPYNGHLLVKQGTTMIGHGPAENRWRPSIDALFRSAAAAYDSHVIGIILTGMLDDGVSGMIAIQRCGGTCIVQDPDEAAYADMPRAVMSMIKPDHSLPLAKMGKTIERVIQEHSGPGKKIPPDIMAEARIAEKAITSIDEVASLGEQSVYTCPDCGGGLWHIQENGMSRYRCYTGHVYSEDSLSLKLFDKTEESLWVAVRLMEERRNLLLKMDADYVLKKHMTLHAQAVRRIEALNVHIARLKDVLFSDQQKPAKPEEGYGT